MQKSMKKFISFLMAIILAVPLLGITAPVMEVKADNGFDVSRYNLEWTTPSVKQDDSMPLGNGEVGLNLWMENERDLVFYISRVGAYADNSTTMKLGRIRITFPEGTFTVSDFSQVLDLSTGSIQIESGNADKKVSLEVWIDANSPVIHVEGNSASAIPVSVAYELDWSGRTLTTLKEAPENHAETEDVLLDDGKNAVTWYHRNAASTWKSEAQSRYIASEENLTLDPIENLTFGGNMRAEGMSRKDAATLSADSLQSFDVRIDIAASQPAMPQEFVDALEEQASATDAADAAAAKQAHIGWWQEYWNTSYIEITDGTFKRPERYKGDPENIGYTITQNYLLQRFMQGAAMRSEHLIPFNGSIFNVQNGGSYTTDSPDTRKWDGLPIMWQNTRAPYWATLSSGDFEQTKTLIDYLYKSLPILKEGAMNRFGVEGAYLAEPMMPYGVPASAFTASHLLHHFTATVEIPLLMVRYYNFTGDTELFQEKILPVVEACLDFMNNFYDENDENGKMIMYPANSLESGEYATNSANMLAPMTALLDELLALPSGSLSSAQMSKFVAMRNRMPELPTRELEGVTFLAQEEAREGFMHGVESPELYSVWPSGLFAPVSSTEDIDIARQTFAARTKYWNLFGDTFKVDMTGGWNQSTLFAAKLGLPYEASYLMTMCALNCIDAFDYPGMPNYGTIPARFPAFWGPYYDWIPDQCHGGNFANALQSMLLQYDSDNNIYLLASWPEDWDVNFKLYGPRNTIVTGSYQDGNLTYTTNNGYDKIVDCSGYENRVINRVSVACADQNEVFKDQVQDGFYQQMPDGKYDEGNLEQYVVTKDWLEKYGEYLNGTTGTAYGWNDWGGVTVNKETGKAYFHFINFEGEITIPNYFEEVADAVCLNDSNVPVTLNQEADRIQISMDTEKIQDPLDIIICADVSIQEETPQEATFINNDDSEIDWTGNWVEVSAAGAYLDDVAEAEEKGAELIYTFEGCGIEVLASTGSQYGKMEISVDGEIAETVSLNGEAEETQRTVYAAHGLDEGEHTIKIINKGDDQKKINLDALVVYQSGAEILNDTDGRIQYAGSWVHETDRDYGEYKKDIHQASGKGADEINFEFYGTGIEAIFTKGGSFSDVDFWVDDREPQTVSLNSGTAITGTVVFSQMNLEPGMHVLHIRRSEGQSGYIAMDAFRVTKPGDETIKNIIQIEEPAEKNVEFGTSFEKLSLPKQVTVTLQDKTITQVDVEWKQDGYDGTSSDTYVLTGVLINLPDTILNSQNLTASVTVNVGLNNDRENPWYVKLDNTDSAFRYYGDSWMDQQGIAGGLYCDTQQTATADGDYFEIEFTGTGIQFFTNQESNRGPIEFYLDNESRGIVDMSQGSNGAQTVAFEVHDLEYGLHTLKGVKRGGEYFTVDAVGIFNDEGNRYITAVESLPQIGCELNGTVEGLLSQTVEVSVDDVEKAQLEVNWDVDSFDSSKEGIQWIQGDLVIPEDSNLVNNSNLKAEVRVFVSESGLAYPGDIRLGLTATEGKCGEPYEGQITAVGGTEPYTYTVYGLPDGLSVSTDGKITGTPSAGGTYQVDVLAKDAAGVRAYQGFELTIDPNVIVEQVVVEPSQAELVKGESLQFTARVEGQRVPSQKVSWEVTGESGLAEGTAITDEGLLTVAVDETNSSLTVTATAAADSSVSGQAAVALKEAGKYHLTVTNGTGSGDYAAKENVTAEAPATDGNGRKFLRWESDELKGLDMTANPLHFVMPECNVTLTAVYESSEEITEVAVEPKEATVFKGDSLQFAAEVKGDGNPSQEVIWGLEAEKPLAEGTEIAQDGMLYVAEAEENENLTVQAVSAADNTVSGQALVTVTEKPRYQLTVINGSGSGEYEPGVEVTVEADEAEPGWRFVRWKSEELKNLDLTVNPLKFEMPECNVTLEAVYEEGQEPTTYPVTVTNGTGSGKYIPGAMVTTEADEAEPGWRFSHWESEALADSGLDMHVNPLQFQMPEKEVALTAVYEEIPTVTKVTVDPAETTLVKGGSQQFTAVVEGENQPAQDVVWKLQADQELAAGTGITPDGLLNVAADEKNDSILVIAESVEDSRVSGQALVTLTEQPAAEYQLTVTGGSGSGTYAEGEQVTVEAPAVEGKKFLYWESDELKGLDMTVNPLVFVMPGCDVFLTAVYEDEQVPGKHQVTVIGGSGSGSYAAGETVQITAEAAPEGQRFSHWQSDELQGLDMTANPLSFEMPGKDVTVTAVYVPKQDGTDGDQDKDDDPSTPGGGQKPTGNPGQGGTTVTPKPGSSGDKTGSADTGDPTQMASWIVLLAGAGAGVVLLNRKRRAK